MLRNNKFSSFEIKTGAKRNDDNNKIIAAILLWNFQAGVNSYFDTPKEVNTVFSFNDSLRWLNPDYLEDGSRFRQNYNLILFRVDAEQLKKSEIMLVSGASTLANNDWIDRHNIASWSVENRILTVHWERNPLQEMFIRIFLEIMLALLVIHSLRPSRRLL